MLLGGTTILACPNCKKPIKDQTYISTNTFGTTIWSDNITSGSMNRNTKSISLCPYCNKCDLTTNFVAIDHIPGMFDYILTDFDGNKIYETEPEILNEKYKDAKNLYSPGLENLKKALSYISNGEKEIRVYIWQIYNYSYRIEPFEGLSSEEKFDYINNAKKLIKLFDSTNEYEKIILAELYRNIGEFEKSKAILVTNNITNQQWVADQILLKIEKKSKYTFKLEPPKIY